MTIAPSRRTWVIGGAAVATAVVLVGSALVATNPPGDDDGRPYGGQAAPALAARTQGPNRGPDPCPVPSGTAAPASGPAADPRTSPGPGTLRILAGSLTAAPADRSAGPHTIIAFRQWAADMSGNFKKPATVTEVVEDHVRTIAADGSGHETITRYPAGTSNPSAGTPGAQTRTEQLEPGGFRDGIAPPLSTDPAILASQINRVQPWENGPFSGLRAIADTATSTYLTCPVRAAALDVLATMGGQDSGPVTDRAGRQGIAITVDSSDHAVRDTLIVDARTGVVLAYELRLLRNPGGYRGRFPRTENYVLFLTSDHRDTTATALP